MQVEVRALYSFILLTAMDRRLVHDGVQLEPTKQPDDQVSGEVTHEDHT